MASRLSEMLQNAENGERESYAALRQIKDYHDSVNARTGGMPSGAQYAATREAEAALTEGAPPYARGLRRLKLVEQIINSRGGLDKLTAARSKAVYRELRDIVDEFNYARAVAARFRERYRQLLSNKFPPAWLPTHGQKSPRNSGSVGSQQPAPPNPGSTGSRPSQQGAPNPGNAGGGGGSGAGTPQGNRPHSLNDPRPSNVGGRAPPLNNFGHGGVRAGLALGGFRGGGMGPGYGAGGGVGTGYAVGGGGYGYSNGPAAGGGGYQGGSGAWGPQGGEGGDGGPANNADQGQPLPEHPTGAGVADASRDTGSFFGGYLSGSDDEGGDSASGAQTDVFGYGGDPINDAPDEADAPADDASTPGGDEGEIDREATDPPEAGIGGGPTPDPDSPDGGSEGPSFTPGFRFTPRGSQGRGPGFINLSANIDLARLLAILEGHYSGYMGEGDDWGGTNPHFDPGGSGGSSGAPLNADPSDIGDPTQTSADPPPPENAQEDWAYNNPHYMPNTGQVWTPYNPGGSVSAKPGLVSRPYVTRIQPALRGASRALSSVRLH